MGDEVAQKGGFLNFEVLLVGYTHCSNVFLMNFPFVIMKCPFYLFVFKSTLSGY